MQKTTTNARALREICSVFKDADCWMRGREKRISEAHTDKAVGAGEGLYWKV